MMTTLRAAVFALGLVCLWGGADAKSVPNNLAPVKRQEEGVPQQEADKEAALLAFSEMMSVLEGEAIVQAVAEIMSRIQQLTQDAEGEVDDAEDLSKRYVCAGKRGYPPIKWDRMRGCGRKRQLETP